MTTPIIDGLVLSLDANLGITKDINNFVSYWEDQSGQENHFQQTNSINQPLYSLIPYSNEYSWIKLTKSSNQYFECIKGDMLKNIPGFTFFMLCKLIDITYNGTQSYFWATNNATYPRFYFELVDPTNRTVQVGGQRLDSEQHRYFKPDFNAVDNTTLFFNASIDYQNGTMQVKPSIRANNQTGGTLQSTGNTSDTNTDSIFIGNNYAKNAPADVYIVEIFAYNRVLTSNEYIDIKEYIKNKYFNKIKTVGIGADFENWSLVSDWLFLSSYYGLNLLGNITFNQISDLTNGQKVELYTTIYQDGHSGSDTVDDLTDKIIVELNGNRFKTQSLYNVISHSFAVSAPDIRVFKIHDIVIEVLNNANGTGIYLSGIGNESEIYNILIYCLTQNNTYLGVHRSGYGPDTFHYRECIFINLHTGTNGSTSGSQPLEFYTRYFSNCIFFNCGFGNASSLEGYAICCRDLVNWEIIFRSVSILRNDEITGRDIQYYDNNKQFINCATSDLSTFTDLKALYPTKIIDCLDNLIASEQLKSTVFGEIDFLKPKKYSGSGVYNSGIIPLNAIMDYDGINYQSPFPIGPYQFIIIHYKILNIPTIGFKHESIPYTPENLIDSDYHYSINNEIKIMVNIENYLQEINTGNFSKFASISGKRMCAVNFSIDLYTMSDTTIAPSYFDILQSCGWKKLLVNEQDISNFESLGVSEFINWMGITNVINGDVYACSYNNGNIYKQTGGEGSFISLNQTLRNWHSMTSNSNGDVYCATEEGGIYKQTNGEGDFILVAQIPSCHGICCTPNNDIYACAYSFGIYKQTNCEGDFVCIWSTVKNFRGITSNSDNDIYTAVYSGDIYKLPNGESNFIALGQTHRNWGGITALQISNDVYANEYGGDIYKQTNGTGDFIALGQITRYWREMSNSDNGIYACAYNVNGIYKSEITSRSGITIFPDSLFNSVPATIEVSFPEEGIEPRQIVYKISGAMGYVKFIGETGKPIKAEFSFIGALDRIYTREFEDLIIPENFDNELPIALLGATFQIFGTDVSLQSFEINSGEIIELFSNIMKHHGYDGTRIVDRNIIGTLEINSDAEIPADISNKIIDNQQGDFLLSVGNLSLISSDVKMNAIEDELKKFKIEFPENIILSQIDS